MPLQQRAVQRRGNFFGQHGLACAGLALDQQRALQRQGRIDGQFQVVGGDIAFGASKAFGRAGQGRLRSFMVVPY